MTTYAYYPDGTLLSQLRTPGPGQADDDTASQPPSARGRGQGNAWLKDKDARRQEALFNFIPKQGSIGAYPAETAAFSRWRRHKG